MKNILTVGMAVHDDFKMLWATVQALKLEIVKYNLPIEILVVDNASHTRDGKKTKTFIENYGGRVRTRYMVCPPELFGTTQPRQMVFDKSETEWTMCIDSHILLWPGSLVNLIQWLKSPHAEDNRDNLFSGPILMDELLNIATHFDLVWDAEMWGKWGTAWWDHERNEYFSVIQHPIEDATCKFIKLTPEVTTYDLGKRVMYYGHQQELKRLGYITAIDRGYPFEIPAMGLGLFMARTESWLGFNRHMRGFGGEEGYIHTKYRNAGRHCVCLPWLQWTHKFNGEDEINYSTDRRNKVRNYMLGFNEVGLPLKPVFEHFIATKLLPQHIWDKMVVDPQAYPVVKSIPPKVMLEKKENDAAVVETTPEVPNLLHCSIHDLFDYFKQVPRDLDKHLETLKTVAQQCPRIVELTHRRESTVGFLAGGPESLFSIQSENDQLTDAIHGALSRTQFDKTVSWTKMAVPNHSNHDYSSLPEEFDALFIDTDGLSSSLEKYLSELHKRVKRFIVVHDTFVYGDMDASASKGLNVVLRAFCEDNPQWEPVFYTSNEFGLTVLGCQEQDKPKKKIMAWKLGKGPGTELKKMNSELGINPAENCSCNRLAAEMDWLGVEGCRRQRMMIIQGLKENSVKYKWTDLMMAGIRSATCSFVTKINPLDIFGSMVDEAIRRAEQNEQSTSGTSKV